MKNLDEFLYKFKDNKQAIPQSFTDTINNFSSNSKEGRNLTMKVNAIKKSIIFATSLLLGSGMVFAATKTYENIWKQPETYEFSYELTEQEKQEAISEGEARKKAEEYLKKIGLEKEINGLSLTKDAYEDKVRWNIGFESGTMEINSKGEFESLNIPSYNYKIPYNYGITREEARKTAKELLSKYNPYNNDSEYKLVSLKRNMENDKASYIWYADFYKKYGDLYNSYEKISIGWVPTINGLYSLNIENYKYENNEQVISKEEAIKIATEKDKQIETRHNITSAEAEIGIDKMNTEVVYREKDIEEYEKGSINFELTEDRILKAKDDAVFYKVDNRVRKVWEVTLYYDYKKYEENGLERFVYYVDATTGEIIGGNRWSGAKKEIEFLIDDQYNLIEK